MGRSNGWIGHKPGSGRPAAWPKLPVWRSVDNLDQSRGMWCAVVDIGADDIGEPRVRARPVGIACQLPDAVDDGQCLDRRHYNSAGRGRN